MEPGQLQALVNLARKAAGQEVNWINISDAQALTLSGLAARDGQGWHITSEGTTRLDREFPSLAHLRSAND